MDIFWKVTIFNHVDMSATMEAILQAILNIKNH